MSALSKSFPTSKGWALAVIASGVEVYLRVGTDGKLESHLFRANKDIGKKFNGKDNYFGKDISVRRRKKFLLFVYIYEQHLYLG